MKKIIFVFIAFIFSAFAQTNLQDTASTGNLRSANSGLRKKNSGVEFKAITEALLMKVFLNLKRLFRICLANL